MEVIPGFLQGLDKKIIKNDKGVWVNNDYVEILEKEFDKVLGIARDALKLSAMSREQLKKLQEEKEVIS